MPKKPARARARKRAAKPKPLSVFMVCGGVGDAGNGVRSIGLAAMTPRLSDGIPLIEEMEAVFPAGPNGVLNLYNVAAGAAALFEFGGRYRVTIERLDTPQPEAAGGGAGG